MATVGGEGREARIMIDSERTPTEVIDNRELVDNANVIYRTFSYHL